MLQQFRPFLKPQATSLGDRIASQGRNLLRELLIARTYVWTWRVTLSSNEPAELFRTRSNWGAH